MSDTIYDVLVIGTGPGGYVTAIRAAQLGLKAAVVEREHLGGICLNWGCIPTKALLRTSEVYHTLAHAEDYGLKAKDVGYDAEAIVKRSRAVSGRLNSGVGGLLKKNKVDVIWGEAKITKPGEVAVSKPAKKAMQPQHPPPRGAKGEGTYKAKHIIIATGARPRVLPGLEPDGKLVWTYFEAMVPERIPKSLVVIGSGAIGMEFASFYATLGTDVTVVEILPQILPAEDAEIAAFARKRFEKQGMKIMTGAKVAKLDKKKDSVAVSIEEEKGGKSEVTVERVISAIGVVGNTDGLGMEDVGVKTDKGLVTVDGFGRTSVSGIYAIGDVAGPPMLAHKASHEGIACVEKIAGLDAHAVEKERIPACTYCHPQIASVGLSEAEAKQAGREVRVGRFSFVGNGKAIALGDDQGMVKTVFDAKTGQLLGAHLVGPEVTELIQGFAIAMNLETTEQELIQTVFPHPTLSESMHESVLDAYGRVIHM